MSLLGVNPVNYRWFYMLEDLIDEENDQESVKQMRNCQVSLHKFPLAIYKPDKLDLLQHFKKEALDKIKARFAQEESIFVSPQKTFPRVEGPRQLLEDISGTGNVHQIHHTGNKV